MGNGHSGGHTDDGIVLVQLNRNGEDAASAADICHVFISVCFYISVVRTAECDRCISLSVRYSNLQEMVPFPDPPEKENPSGV